MKKVFAIMATIAVLAACAKEIAPEHKTNNEEESASVVEENAGKVMSLFAEVPALADGNGSDSAAPASVDVKATATGTFSWSAGDKIAIPIQGGYAQFEYNSESGKFEYTLTGEEKFINGTAYYPASSVVGGYSTDFNQSTNPASAGFKMEAEYTLGCSSLSFTHKSALISLNFTNVPSFATSVRVKIGDSVAATVALPTTPGTTFAVDVPVTPASGNASYSFALLENSNVLREVSKTVSLTAGKYYSTPVIAIPVYVYVTPFTGWTNLYAYIYYQDNSYGDDWPGTKLDGGATYTIAGTSYYRLPVDASKESAHLILNAGDTNLAKPFTRIETSDSFSVVSSKRVTLSAVSQDNLILYFRDDTGQNDNWGDYKIYGWYSDESKIFGDWPGWSKNAGSFTWNDWGNYGQSNNWIAQYEFSGKPAINLIINDGGSNQTSDINLSAGKDNWFVVSNGCTGTASTESFPTVSISVQ